MDSIRAVRWGVVLALSSILFGFTMGALFGLNEPALKGHLEAEGKAVLAEKYGGDAAKLKTVLDKSWVYFQRAHLHGGGIGAVALGLCLLLSSLPACPRARSRSPAPAPARARSATPSTGCSPGLKAPRLGGTSAAKETLEWLAIPASGLALVGLVLTLVLASARFGRAPTVPKSAP